MSMPIASASHLADVRAPKGYRIERVSRYPEPQFKEMADRMVVGETGYVPAERILSEEERKKLKSLKSGAVRQDMIRLAAYQEREFVGWSYGWNEGDGSFYMAHSAVLPDHRRQGLYTAMVARMIRETRERGFLTVRSRHLTVNSAVLIAKLRCGFVLTGMEYSDLLGNLAVLTFHHSIARRKLTQFRAGAIPPDPETQAWFRPEAEA